jgi:ATP-dependent Clp protease ATP-binding subunit ClpA
MGYASSEDDNLAEALEAPGLAGIFSSVDLKVPFGAVSGHVLREIVELEADDLASVLSENGRTLDVTPELVDVLFESCSDASPSEARRRIRRELEMLLARCGAELENVKLGLEDFEAAHAEKEK